MKKILLLVLLISIKTSGFSQVHIRGSNIHSFDVSAGFIAEGSNAKLAYNHYRFSESRAFFRIEAEYLNSSITGKDVENFNRDINFPIVNYGANISYNLNILQFPNRGAQRNMDFYTLLSVGVGATVNYERINDNTYKLETGEEILDRSKITYGGIIRTEFEIFFGVNNITAFVAADQRYITSSDIGTSLYSFSFGVRYWFNN